jgi:hypothetical protein
MEKYPNQEGKRPKPRCGIEGNTGIMKEATAMRE